MERREDNVDIRQFKILLRPAKNVGLFKMKFEKFSEN